MTKLFMIIWATIITLCLWGICYSAQKSDKFISTVAGYEFPDNTIQTTAISTTTLYTVFLTTETAGINYVKKAGDTMEGDFKMAGNKLYYDEDEAYTVWDSANNWLRFFIAGNELYRLEK